MLLKRRTEQRSRGKEEGDKCDCPGRMCFKEKSPVKPQKPSEPKLALVKEH